MKYSVVNKCLYLCSKSNILIIMNNNMISVLTEPNNTIPWNRLIKIKNSLQEWLAWGAVVTQSGRYEDDLQQLCRIVKLRLILSVIPAPAERITAAVLQIICRVGSVACDWKHILD